MRRTCENATRPLSHLAGGESARIVYIVPGRNDRMVRLSNLGLIPGATITLRQKRPAAVVAVGETVLAVDREVADSIYVTRLAGS